ncbi:MAG: diguanylate cyclase [Thermoanaerobaculales bacterium]|nr:diguanylate cyclase [Thermoanaerobaculales bacterium]
MKRRTFTTVILACSLIVFLLMGARICDDLLSSGRTIGISVDDSDEILTVTQVIDGRPASEAGLETGDIIESIDGSTLSSVSEILGLAATFERDTPVEFKIMRGEETRHLTICPGIPFPWTPLGLDLLVILGYLSIALLAHFRAPDVLRARLLSGFSIAVALELALPRFIPGFADWILFREIFYYSLTGAQLGLELHLASVIPKKYDWFTSRPWLPKLYYGIGLFIGTATALIATTAPNLGVPGLEGANALVQSIVNDFVLGGWGIAVVALLFLQFRNSKTPGHRSQALLVLVGVLPWAVFNLCNSVLTRLDVVSPQWTEFVQPMVLLFYPAAIFIAIFRYHFFDIDLVLRRSLVIAVVTCLVIILFSVVFENVASRFGEQVNAGKWQVAAFALGMLILGLLFNPVRAQAQKSIDSRFFPERLAQREHLAELAASLPNQGSLSSMGQHLVEEVSKVFQVESATVMVADPRSGILLSLASNSPRLDGFLEISLLIQSDDAGIEQLRKARRPIPADIIISTSPAMAQRIHAVGAELGVGLISKERLIGILLLGPKVNRERFRSEELDLLRLFSLNVATVLENVRLFQSATYEQLTGLLRREAILEALDGEINRASRYHRPLTVGMVDLDHFKRVNDSWGHLAGDAILQKVAGVLQENLRSTDRIGRYGGEEFLFILPETTMNEGLSVADKLRQALEDMNSPVEEASELRVTASIGLAELKHGDNEHPPGARDLIAAADSALLMAKHRGRNLVVAADMSDSVT